MQARTQVGLELGLRPRSPCWWPLRGGRLAARFSSLAQQKQVGPLRDVTLSGPPLLGGPELGQEQGRPLGAVGLPGPL